MKKAIILIVMIFLFGCSFLNPIDYTYKTSGRYPILTKSEIRENPNVGVAILSEDGPYYTYYVERGIYAYVNYKAEKKLVVDINFHDMGSEIVLNENKNIANADSILKKHLGVRYVLYIWKNLPEIKRHTSSESRTIRSHGKEKVVWDTVYETSISIDSKTVLFDLVGNEVLAKAEKTFRHSYSVTQKQEKPISILITLLLNPLSAFSESYPPVDFNGIDRQFENYVYYFLEKINEK
jgi:hypothetical protein